MERWDEGEREDGLREIWREMWSRTPHSVCSSFIFSLLLFPQSFLLTLSQLLGHRFFFLLPICDESHALPPFEPPLPPQCLPSFPAPLPFLFSPFLKYIQCWHGQIARLGRDYGHHRAFRGGGGLSCNGEEVGQRVSTGTGRSFFGGGSVPPTRSPHNMRMTLLFRPFFLKNIFLTTPAAQCNKETKAKWASKRVDWLLEKREVGAHQGGSQEAPVATAEQLPDMMEGLRTFLCSALS